MDLAQAKPAQQVITLRSLLEEMVDRDHIARWPEPAFTVRQVSSYDRSRVCPICPRISLPANSGFSSLQNIMKSNWGISMTNLPIIERQAIRAFLLTPDHEILLLRILPPGGGSPFWIAPGGGQEPGETAEETLRRELREELGLTEFEIGPVVWLRQHTFTWGDKRYCQREQFHILHVSRFLPAMTDEVEAKYLDRFHWWPVADLQHTDEVLTPLSLVTILHDYISHGMPSEPLAVEILVD